MAALSMFWYSFALAPSFGPVNGATVVDDVP